MNLQTVRVGDLMTRQFVTFERSGWPPGLPRGATQIVLLTHQGQPIGAAFSQQLATWLATSPGRHPDTFPWLPVQQVPDSLPVLEALGTAGPALPVAMDAGGKPVGILMWYDVARFLDDEYQKLHARFHTAIDTLEESLSMIDEEGRVIAWNRRATQLFGIKPAAIIGRHLSDFFPDRDQWSYRALTTGVSVHQALFEPHPGTWVIINSTPVRLGDRTIGALAVEQDVTSLVKLNEQLYRTTSSMKALEGEVARMRRMEDPFGRIGGRGEAIRAAVAVAAKVAPSDATVLIRGESGVGKEVFARAIHDASERRDKPFVAINCGAIPAALFESELFGYEKGAFTGADYKGKPGKLEQAQGGTLFLDEIGELPMETQVKLLRVLQDRRFYRLGSEKPREVDVRILAATNRNLEEMLRQGTFREDLYFRLNVVSLELPPLRERLDDLPELVHAFMQEFALRYKRPIHEMEPEVMLALMNYTWPGNIRELRNVIERLVVLTDDSTIRAVHLPTTFKRPAGQRDAGPKRETAHSNNATSTVAPAIEGVDFSASAREAQRKAIVAALTACGNNRSRAAKRLGISRSALYYQMKRLGLA